MFASILALVLLSQGGDIVIPKAVGMHLKLENPIGSVISKTGDPFVVSLIEPVVFTGKSVLPKGTRISGTILLAIPADVKSHTHANVRVAFDNVTLPNDRGFSIPETLVDRDMDCERSMTVGVALFGSLAVAATEYSDFMWKSGHKTWCHLHFDLTVPSDFK